MARAGTMNGTGKVVTQQSLDAIVWDVCDIMRRSNCAGALQYVPELTWILFLRILDEREEAEAQEAAAVGGEFTPSLAEPFRWRDWAAPPPKANGNGAGLFIDPRQGHKRAELVEKSGAFFGFVNDKLLPHLQGLRDQPNARGELTGTYLVPFPLGRSLGPSPLSGN
jgi:type I restriction enzyme M protein